MKKIIKTLLFLALSIMTTGCLDITEEITLNTNGSSTYTIIQDITKYIEYQKSTNSTDETVKKSLDSTSEILKKNLISISGVSAVSLDETKENIMKISLNFADINVLNKVLDIDKKNVSGMNLYALSKRKLIRKDAGISSLIGDGFENEETAAMLNLFLDKINYKTIYHLPNEVKKMKNKDATLSSDKKTVTLEVSLENIKNMTKTLANEITY